MTATLDPTALFVSAAFGALVLVLGTWLSPRPKAAPVRIRRDRPQRRPGR